MVEIFNSLLGQLNSSVIVLIAILLLAFFLTFKLGGWKQTFVHYGDRIGNVERLSDTVIAVQTKVDLIYQLVNPNSPTRAASPIGLTEVGTEIIAKIDAEKIFQNHAVRLISLVDNKAPKTAYDIQQASFTVAKQDFITLLTETELSAIKQEAFGRGLLLEDIMSIFGVLLRNKILTDRNIPIADVDKRAKAQG